MQNASLSYCHIDHVDIEIDMRNPEKIIGSIIAASLT